MFIDRLIESITEKRNPSVVGLDTLLGYVPRSIREKHAARLADPAAAAAEAIFEFNARIIDRVCDIVPAVKPQLAYFELYGPSGAECFRKTADYARAKGLLVIADAKRNDIGSTATAYADAYLGETELGGGEAMRALGAGAMDASPKPGGGDAMRAYAADAMTVNPYLGADGVEPFLKNCDKYGKGIFVLVKTSNPSSGQLQDLE
ncbi:MAG: orotidine-5'-phosphate decarboxylase, partial [Clostridiales bacterium]|nr:orotidine-5'-phosphate decarboxylase [Clostridiales bacterium]